jgi:hypothetical protein
MEMRVSGHFATQCRGNLPSLGLAIFAFLGGHDKELDPCMSTLLRWQNTDGGCPAFFGDNESCWTTVLALLTISIVGGPRIVLNRAAHWPASTFAREVHWLWRWKLRTKDRQAQIDPDKYGWPWVPGTSSWVIPTAFAIYRPN